MKTLLLLAPESVCMLPALSVPAAKTKVFDSRTRTVVAEIVPPLKKSVSLILFVPGPPTLSAPQITLAFEIVSVFPDVPLAPPISTNPLLMITAGAPGPPKSAALNEVEPLSPISSEPLLTRVAPSRTTRKFLVPLNVVPPPTEILFVLTKPAPAVTFDQIDPTPATIPVANELLEPIVPNSDSNLPPLVMIIESRVLNEPFPMTTPRALLPLTTLIVPALIEIELDGAEMVRTFVK